MHKKISLTVFLFSFFITRTFASFDFNARVQSAYSKIIALHLEEGKKLLDEEAKAHPENNLVLLYYNYIDFLKAFINEEKKSLDTLRYNSEKRLEKLDRDKSDSPFLLYSKAEIILQTAMVRVKFRENISSALDIRKSFKLIERNAIAYPSFPLNKKVLGFLHALVGVVPQEYHWIVSFAGMDGTIPQGTGELNGLLSTLSSSGYESYRPEILFLLTNIYVSFSKNENYAEDLLHQLKPLCENYSLMKYCYSNVTMRTAKNEEALETLLSYHPSKDEFDFIFLKYKTAIAKFHKLDFSAVDDFKNFLRHFRGLNYIKSSYQKLAWIALLEGDEKKYRLYLDSCLITGNDFTDEDKDAVKESESRESPDTTLLRARMLFDGGYYSKALSEIISKSTANYKRTRDHLEVTYRLARIFDKMKETEKAIVYYTQTFEHGASSKYYFAANSALMLGNIYEEKKDFEKAKSFYNKCLSLRHHDYQNSIDQKAQAGLERIAAIGSGQ